jgi:nitroimidazol reductase NimA-like FMN-containing flavoprotein (pyridoxamine 5'-phosphate oxidase superfamily)
VVPRARAGRAGSSFKPALGGWRWFNAVVHETPADLLALQDLLDRSYAAAGSHLRSIITPQRRLNADEVADRLTGMCLLALATVTADGRPIVGPVDGIFFRGAFYFGSSPDSVRFRHIRKRPQVSATHLPGEELSVTVHGRAVPLDVHSEAAAEFRQTLLGIYVPRYGPQWEDFLNSGPLYARIDAGRMFTLCMTPDSD